MHHFLMDTVSFGGLMVTVLSVCFTFYYLTNETIGRIRITPGAGLAPVCTSTSTEFDF